MNDNATAHPHHTLWYTGPARDWLEGRPVGTGRLAAMVMGTHKRERIALNRSEGSDNHNPLSHPCFHRGDEMP
jgi:hypothetical protein